MKLTVICVLLGEGEEDVAGAGTEGLSVRLVQHNRKAVLGPDSKQMFNCFRAVLTLLDCVPPLKGGGGAENPENPAADERERERGVGGCNAVLLKQKRHVCVPKNITPREEGRTERFKRFLLHK